MADEPVHPPENGPAATGEIRLGETIAGRYVIESRLGSGGMGAVLRAHDMRRDEPVAVKVMHRELLAMEDASRRFELEAQATASLKSPHAVRVHEIDRLPSGTPYMVMELLEGIDLGAMLATRGPLPLERAIHYLIQATDAIAEAHARGIVHRDLKPRNLFLNSKGIIKVLDFGLAKTLRGADGSPPLSARVTAANVLIGSPNYMSPEQLSRGGTVDERTDIWCLGVTLFHLVAGEPPFQAPSLAELMVAITTREPPRVTDRRADVSPTVDAVIAQCLRKNPDERYRSVTAFRNSLLHVRSELESEAQAASQRGGAQGTTVPEDQLPVLPPTSHGKPSLPPLSSNWKGDDEPTQMSLPESTSPESERELAASKRAR